MIGTLQSQVAAQENAFAEQDARIQQLVGEKQALAESLEDKEEELTMAQARMEAELAAREDELAALSTTMGHDGVQHAHMQALVRDLKTHNAELEQTNAGSIQVHVFSLASVLIAIV